MIALGRIWARLTSPSRVESHTFFVPVQAGVHVTHEGAMKMAAVYRAVAYISGAISQCPWGVYQEQPESGKVRLHNDVVDRLLGRRPSPELTPFTFREWLIALAILWGNSYAEIERDMVGRPAALWPIHPRRVTVRRNASGGLYYDVTNENGPNSHIMPENMFHLRGLGFDPVVGTSVISLAARSIGLSLAAEEHAAGFFERGATTSGILKIAKTLKDEALKRIREQFTKQHVGAKNAHRPLILDGGAEWQDRSVSPKDAQMLEHRKFQVEEVCRWLGVPKHVVFDMEKTTFDNMDQMNRQTVQHSLIPWVVRLEQEANAKLLGQRPSSVTTEINLDALLRGSPVDRAERHEKLRNSGALTANEIRREEGLPPVGPEGDKLLAPMNYTTLERVGEEPALQKDAMQSDKIEEKNRDFEALEKDVTTLKKDVMTLNKDVATLNKDGAVQSDRYDALNSRVSANESENIKFTTEAAVTKSLTEERFKRFRSEIDDLKTANQAAEPEAQDNEE